MIRLPVYLAAGIATGLLLGNGPGLADAPEVPIAGTTATVQTLVLVATLLVAVLAWRWAPARWAASALALGGVCWALSDASRHPFWLGGLETTGEAPSRAIALALVTLLLSAATHAAEEAIALRDAILARGELPAVARRDAGRAVLRWMVVAGAATIVAGVLMLAAAGLDEALGDLDDPTTRTIALTAPFLLLAIGALLLGGDARKPKPKPAAPDDAE
ncbi:MAG: hypothetical protein QOD77_2110 [Thermoplasmata archaeon]|jgi:hypothetical protein|nr:hypothetical protein [Thermoplasmata archaeon]